MPTIIHQIIYFIVYSILSLLCSFGIFGTFIPIIVKHTPHFVLKCMLPKEKKSVFEEMHEDYPDNEEIDQYIKNQRFIQGIALGASVTAFILAIIYYFFYLKGAYITNYLDILKGSLFRPEY